MAIKVHGVVISGNVMRVMACLLEKGLHFEVVPINLSDGEHKSHPFLSLNPFGQVPAFEDGDLKLFESRAITKYIAHNYADSGTQLIPKDPKKAAVVSVWSEVEALQFHKPASELAYELAVKPLLGMTTDEVVVEEFKPKLAAVLDVYEARLAQSKYLGGDCFTIADLHHLPNVQYLMETKLKELFESRPHVRAWCADVLSRPAWLSVVAMRKSA